MRMLVGTKQVPCCDDAMRTARATNIRLAERTGVSTNTVARARAGDKILTYLADAIMETLCKEHFVNLKYKEKK